MNRPSRSWPPWPTPAALARGLRAGLGTGVVLLAAAGCARGTSLLMPAPSFSPTPPSPDPRVGLKAGLHDAGEAAWNLTRISNSPSPQGVAGVTNSDLAFTGPYAIQENYSGFMVWDISSARKPTIKKSYLCPASQSDVSVYKHLLFVSAEGLTGRLDCGGQGVSDTVLSAAEKLSGAQRRDALNALATRMHAEARSAKDAPKAHTTASAVGDLAKVTN